MQRRTTTKQLNTAITNNLLKLTKAEVYYKTSHKTDVIETETILENFQFLSESGAFMDCISWSYKKDYKTNGYICETGRTNGDLENIITVYLRACNNTSDGEIEKMLLFQEE